MIDHGSGPLLIEGGAGVGKSSRSDRNGSSRLVSSGLDPSRIAVITSTANAAAEHRDPARSRPRTPYEELVVLTWEGFAERLLRRNARSPPASIPASRSIGPAERLAMLLVRFDDLPLRHHQIRGNPTGLMTGLLRRIDRLKRDGVTPEDAEGELSRARGTSRSRSVSPRWQT